MSARLRAILGVSMMSALLMLYFGFVGVRAIALLQSRETIAIVMGVALILLPILGLWALIREIVFGYQATELADVLARDGDLPAELDVPLEGAGVPRRQLRDEADAVFPKYRDEVTQNESSWKVWMRLGLIYDAAGDRRRARSAIRQAITLKRDGNRTLSPEN